MSQSLTARARMVLPANTSQLSASRGGSLALVASGLESLVGNYFAIAPMVDGPPATYADLTDDIGGDPLQQSLSQGIVYDPVAFTFTLTITWPVTALLEAEGAELWVALFTGVTDAPGPTDVPVAVAGPFVVAA